MDTAGPSRVHPIASARYRRREEASSSIPETEDDPQIEEGDGDGEGVGIEESEELTAPFPSGPTNITLLCSFKTHIVADICIDEANI